MAISLTKGGNVSLTKVAPSLTKMNIGLGVGCSSNRWCCI